MSNWAESARFYHIYPLGLCGCEHENSFVGTESRILKLKDWVQHISELGFNALYLGPVFESNAHGYDTVDYFSIDRRLGTNENFKSVCDAFHNRSVKIVLDGVFNHVGRDFWAFNDVKEHRHSSRYKDWFHINFDGNSNYNDGFWYDGWEGHYELVRLNLQNPEVQNHIFDAVSMWVKEFDIDGLRLDVAYCLDKDFLRKLSAHCRSLKSDFWLLGEMLHGDYKTCVNSEMLNSATNYVCYKGLYSSFNDSNMFEIAHTIRNQYGHENWCLYTNMHMYNFVDNHDVSRIASLLHEPSHLSLIYALLYTMPGIPSVYYGSEWGILGDKNCGDHSLRPCLEIMPDTNLTTYIKKLNEIYCPALSHGDYSELALTNKTYVFQRQTNEQRVIVAINIDSTPATAHFNANCGRGTDLLTGQFVDFGGGTEMPPYSAQIILCEC